MTDLPHACDRMRYAVDEPTLLVTYSDRYRHYGIEYENRGSIQHIEFCPFCGAQFPPTLRTEWIERIRGMGLDPWDDPIPDAFQSDRWWRDAGL